MRLPAPEGVVDVSTDRSPAESSGPWASLRPHVPLKQGELEAPRSVGQLRLANSGQLS